MIFILSMTGITISIIFVRIIRFYKFNKEKQGFMYFFCKNILDFLVPFSVVASIFSVLSVLLYYIEISSIVNYRFLIYVQELLDFISQTVYSLKLSFHSTLLILILISVIGISKSAFFAKVKVLSIKSFDFYGRWFTIIYVILLTMASFTFFANDIVSHKGKIKVKIGFIEKRYKNVLESFDQKISEYIDNVIHEKIISSMPALYIRIIKEQRLINYKVKRLIDQSKTNYQKYGIVETHTEIFIKKYYNQQKLLSKVISNVKKIEIEKIKQNLTDLNSCPPSSINEKKINKVEKKIVRFFKNSIGKTKFVFSTFLGPSITPHMLKSVYSKGSSLILNPVFRQYHIMEPICEAFTNASSDVTEKKIRDFSSSIIRKFSDKKLSLSKKNIKVQLDRLVDKCKQINIKESTSKITMQRLKSSVIKKELETATKSLDLLITQHKKNIHNNNNFNLGSKSWKTNNRLDESSYYYNHYINKINRNINKTSNRNTCTNI